MNCTPLVRYLTSGVQFSSAGNGAVCSAMRLLGAALAQDAGGALLSELLAVQVVVIALAPQQLLMLALLHDVAVFHHQDHVRLADGGETMGYQKGGAVRQQMVDGVLDQLLRLGVDGGCLLYTSDAADE